MTCDDYDIGIIIYIARYCLNKASKMGKNWKNVIAASTKPPGYEICEKAYDYFNCMNDKYDGK